MKDLTRGPIAAQLMAIAMPMAVTSLMQITYQLINLYFVTEVGLAATAGANIAGSVIFIVAALTQVLAVGTLALVARATGENNQTAANAVFNQSLMLSAVAGTLIAALLLACARPYLQFFSDDAAAIDAGVEFMCWSAPGFAVTFPLATMSAALRGSGVVRPTVVAATLNIIANTALAPVLIAGWGTGRALGMMGAGLTGSIAMIVGFVYLIVYCIGAERYLIARPAQMRPRMAQWRQIALIGLPAGGELVLTFVSTAVVYYAIRDLGTAAQAGFGIGSRLIQVILALGMAVSLATAPIVGQSFGAGDVRRVSETFWKAVLIGTLMMAAIAVLLQCYAHTLVSALFHIDALTLAVATVFLQLRAWSLVPQCIALTCASVFQGLGNTAPSLVSSSARFFVFSITVLWLSAQQQFRIEHIWYVWLISALLQALLSSCLLRSELKRAQSPKSGASACAQPSRP